MTPELSLLLALLAGGMLLIAGGAYWWVNRTPTIDRDEAEPLPLFAATTAEERMRTPPAPAVVPPAAPAEAPPAAPVVEPPERSAPVIREFVSGVAAKSAAVPATPPGDHAVVNTAGVPGTMVEAHALRFSVPAEGTLQFLPGRLEIGSGLDEGREIRFVRVEGPNGIEVTFGRADGELYRHIQLRDKTVSRAHAIMRFRDATWFLQNLSHTNPVVHNGTPMTDEAAHALADGDRIEMGEVVFTFRSR